MKRDTKLRAIERLIAADAAKRNAEAAAEDAASACMATLEEDATKAASAAWKAHQHAHALDAAWRSMAKHQRDYASTAVAAAVSVAEAAVAFGGSYSGSTSREVAWGEFTTATTTVSKGDQYSRRCTYRKTDALHKVTISVDGVVDLLEANVIREASREEGMPLIAYRAATGEATWVTDRNKRLVAVRGWIAAEGDTIYHSTESLDHARRGLARKAAAAARSAERSAEDARAARRAKLVVRLCRGAVATVADAVAAGYCQAGIQAWQQRHGIGDSAPLAELVRTGDPLATRLAFDLARRVRRDATAGV